MCDVRPQKEEQERTRLIVGGEKIDYYGPILTQIADIITAKVIFNSVISIPGASFITYNIKNFYLVTPMKIYEYIRLHINIIPQEIIDKYNFNAIKDEKE